MAVLDLYSKRKKRAASAGAPELYSYDPIPRTLRVQIVHIWRDALGVREQYGSPDVPARWLDIHDLMAREKGVFQLSLQSGQPLQRCVDWFLNAETDHAIDMIELTFRVVERLVAKLPDFIRKEQGLTMKPARAIEELNQRFHEQGLGYEFAAGCVIRKDNQYLHEEVVKPALSLVYGQPGFEKAVEEFLLAHKHHREHNDKDCIVAAQRAFESTLKAICAAMKWNYSKGDRLPELIKVVRANGLLPTYLDSGLDAYVAMIKTGLPGVRNNAGGHGDEPAAPPVPGYLARYALHVTASNIVLAVEAMNQLKGKPVRRGPAS